MAALLSLQQLRYLIALHEEQHLDARRKRVSSRRARCRPVCVTFESTLDVTLVERDRRHVAFTATGEAVVERARDVLVAQANDLVELCATARNPLTGDFRLGVILPLRPFALPSSLATLRAHYPKPSYSCART